MPEARDFSRTTSIVSSRGALQWQELSRHNARRQGTRNAGTVLWVNRKGNSYETWLQ